MGRRRRESARSLKEKLTRTEQRIPHRVTPDVQRQPSSPPWLRRHGETEFIGESAGQSIPIHFWHVSFGDTHCVALNSHFAHNRSDRSRLWGACSFASGIFEQVVTDRRTAASVRLM